MLYFLHIPKTAGITLKSLLADHFPVTSIAPFVFFPDLYQYSPSDLRQFELFTGHLSYGLVQYLARPCDIITFLRRPIDQAISFFFDLRANGHIAEDVTLGDMLRTGQVQRIINLQTRWIASDYLNSCGLGYDADDMTREDALRNFSDTCLLEKAKRRLRNMRFVGLVENFSDSYRLLCEEFGWPARCHVPNHNARSDKKWSLVDKESIEQLHGLLNLDEELYAYGCSLFSARIKQSQKGGEVSPLYPNEAYRQRVLSRSACNEWLYTFDQPLAGTGWHERELLTDGTFGRWTTDRCCLDVALCTESDVHVTFFVIRALHFENILGLQLHVNGVGIPLERHFSERGSAENVLFRGRIPISVMRAGHPFSRVEIEVPETTRPCDRYADVNDDRELGIMLKWISITPAL